MSRIWNSIAAGPIDMYGVLGFIVLVLGACALVGAAWHFFPGWLPRASWFRWLRRMRRPSSIPGGFRRPRWRKPEPKPAQGPVPEPLADDVLPDLPAFSFRARADTFAAEGRYAEAVRERLRAIVRDLVDARVIDLHPEWTVTELARAAGVVRPVLEPALSGAGGVFSDIWYGERAAHIDHDHRMRTYDAEVTRALCPVPAGSVPAGAAG